MKLTKAQRKNQDRITAWLNQEPFKENSRDKHPQIPQLDIEDVLQQYAPPDISGAGQFFTPTEMSSYALSYLDGVMFLSDKCKILEPCAGIGNLIYAIPEHHEIHAYEIERECVELGQRLFPHAIWHHDSPFCHIPEIENQFDFVIMNPPVNVKRATCDAIKWSNRTAYSHYLFFELGCVALKEGGQMLVIAPYNFVERMPKKTLQFMEDNHVILEYDTGKLPGEFEYTKISVNGFLFSKNSQDVTDEYLDVLSEQPSPQVDNLDAILEFRNVGLNPVQMLLAF
jgi:type I restriction-modification system DNA methylase subunit